MKPHLIFLTGMAVFATAFAAQAKDLRIENKRNVALTELTITAKDGGAQETFVLAKNIAPGVVTTGTVPARKCLFDLKGTFADQSTLAAEDMDLCSQRTIRLVK
jgi:hypothetical protein